MDTTGVGDGNPFAPATPPVVSEPDLVRGAAGGGGNNSRKGAEEEAGGVASIGPDNPFAAALTSISLNGGGNVPSVSSTSPKASKDAGSGANAVATTTTGGGSIASKLSVFVDSVSSRRSGASAEHEDYSYFRQQQKRPEHPFEDGILGEGLTEHEAGGTRLLHPGDAMSQAEASASARERDLERREARIRQQEELLESQMARLKRKNWPPFKPILYHDINAEIPPINRSMVRVAYVAWLLTATGYVTNWFLLTLMFFGASGAGFSDWFFASVFMLSGVPLSFWAWYLGLYAVSQNVDRPGFFLTAAYARFFINFGFHLLMAAWMIMGLPVVGTGCAVRRRRELSAT